MRVAWVLGAVLAAICLMSLFYQPVGWGPRLLVVALALAAAIRPYHALLIIAVLGPLATTTFGILRAGPVPVDFAEAMTLAWLAGFSANRTVRGRPLAIPAPILGCGVLLLSLALASLGLSAVIMRTERPDETVGELFRTFVTRAYLINANELSAAMLFAEGVVLMLAAADLCAADRLRRDRVLRLMAWAAAVAGLLNVFKLFGGAMAHPDPWPTLWSYLSTSRVNIHFRDLNAAGSYFAMMIFIAIGAFRHARLAAAIACGAIGMALWIAGSRTALAVVILIAAIGGVMALRATGHRRSTKLALLAGLAALAVAGWHWYPEGRNLGGSDAFSFRIATAEAAVDLIAAHPLAGVGLGRFHALSGVSENAHNNLLQIGAELGMPALVLFVILVAAALRQAWQSDGAGSRGLVLGLAAFLLTSLAGHPLLVQGAAYPFWMALGLAASSGTPGDRGSLTLRRAAIAGLLIIAVTLPVRIAAAIRSANVEHASVGFSSWQRTPDGVRYRWAGGRASFFVPASARAVRFVLRRGTLAPDPVEVRIFLDGVEANRVVLRADDEPRTVRLVFIRQPNAPFSRVDLEAGAPGASGPLALDPTPSAGVLLVERHVIEP